MSKCCLCGKDVTPGKDCIERFTGRMKYVCFDCYKLGDKQVKERIMNISRARRLEKKNATRK